MADKEVLTDNDDDIDIVEVEQLPPPGAEPARVEDEDESEEDDDQEDARLADHEDDEDDAAPAGEDSASRKKRLKRKQMQKQARDRTISELAELRRVNAELLTRVSAVEGRTLSIDEGQLDGRLEQVREDIATAERILAAALTASNGEDAATALRLRDEAKEAERRLLNDKSTFTEVRKRPAAADPAVVQHSTAWKQANAGWYGTDAAATAAANALDARVAADGFDPKTPAYWQELTRRMKNHFGVDDETSERKPKGDATTKKKPPPQGQTREHAPTSTRTQVYVTPERKQAMVDAGIWDDPQRRAKMLKAYADFDRDQSAQR